MKFLYKFNDIISNFLKNLLATPCMDVKKFIHFFSSTQLLHCCKKSRLLQSRCVPFSDFDRQDIFFFVVEVKKCRKREKYFCRIYQCLIFYCNLLWMHFAYFHSLSRWTCEFLSKKCKNLNGLKFLWGVFVAKKMMEVWII
jgi:hypothetical protein